MTQLLPYLAILSPVVAIAVTWGAHKTSHGYLMAEMTRVQESIHALRNDINGINVTIVGVERDLRAHEAVCNERWATARRDQTPVED